MKPSHQCGPVFRKETKNIATSNTNYQKRMTMRTVIDILTLTEEEKSRRQRSREKLGPDEVPFEMNHIIQLRNAGKDIFRGDLDPMDRFAGYHDERLLAWVATVIQGYRKVVASYPDIDFTPVGKPHSIMADIVGVGLRLRLESIATLADGRRLYLYYHVKSQLLPFVHDMLLHGAKRVSELLGDNAEVAIVDAFNGRLIRLETATKVEFVEQCMREAGAKMFH